MAAINEHHPWIGLTRCLQAANRSGPAGVRDPTICSRFRPSYAKRGPQFSALLHFVLFKLRAAPLQRALRFRHAIIHVIGIACRKVQPIINCHKSEQSKQLIPPDLKRARTCLTADSVVRNFKPSCSLILVVCARTVIMSIGDDLS